ncbi:MAG: hypothetical protein KAG86_01960 [Gammaproteobacteria bacterium]|nr:hypothetical protein [Gammaproteobacteria bacterium]
MSDRWDFWIDRGGTFTDVVVHTIMLLRRQINCPQHRFLF